MNIILILLLIVLFGYFLTKAIIYDTGFIESVGLSFLLGMGILTFVIFISSWSGIHISTDSILVMLSILILITFFVCIKLNRKLFIFNHWSFRSFNNMYLYEKLLIIVIVAMLTISLLLSTFYPITVWDALALYDFRAKVIAELGFFVQIAKNYEYFSHYPLLTSLMHTVYYLFGGTNPQFLYSIFLFSFVAIYYIFIRKKVTRFTALVSTLLMITIPRIFEHSTIAYTNLPYTVFYVSGLLYLYESYVNERYDYLLISSLLIGLSTWTRSDLPFWITPILFVVFVALNKKSIKALIVYLVPFLLIQQPWSVFSASMFGTGYSTAGQLSMAGNSLLTGIDINRLINTFIYLYKNIFVEWGALLLLFVVSAFIQFRNKFDKKSLFLLLMILLNILGLFFSTYVFSMRFSEWKEIADSAVRMSIFFPPLMLYYITITLGENDE